jgi:hypothetical protein
MAASAPARIGKALRLAALVAAFALAAELGARIDDVLFHDGSLLGSTSQDDLWVTDELGRHGRPDARYAHVHMNSLGLAGPEPVEGNCRRILFLGGSETFGIPDIRRGSYVDVFREHLPADQCFQVLNGAIPGMTVNAMNRYYREWAAASRPDVVIIYPSTHFYLSTEAPGATTPARGTNVARGSAFGVFDDSRLFGRLRNVLTVPRPIQRLRERRWIDAQAAGQSAGWLFERAPEERLELLGDHLRLLLSEIRRSGAEPVLVTHAVSASRPAVPEDDAFTGAMRVFMPRATAGVIAEFPYQANDVIREVGRETSVPVIDAAAQLAGRREYFVDLVHLGEAGREEMGELLAGSLDLPP